MTTTQAESFNDTCTLYRATRYQDSNTGELLDSFDSGAVFACGLAVGPEFRNERGQVVTIDADAVLRLAAGSTIAVGDKVIARGKTYYADGVQLGHNVQVVALQEVKA